LRGSGAIPPATNPADLSGNPIPAQRYGALAEKDLKERGKFRGSASVSPAGPLHRILSPCDLILADILGSTRVVALPSTMNNTMSIVFNQAYYPYGDEVYSQTFDPGYKFTGYERDPETGLDYAFARYYNYRLGRFMSADPAGGDLSDPQTENRYAYVRNNPANMTDPSGLCGGFSFGFGYDPFSSPFFSGGGDGEGGGGGFSFGVGIGSLACWAYGSDRQPPIYTPPAPYNPPNPFSGETAGIPNGLSIPLQNPISFLIPSDPSCLYGGGCIEDFRRARGYSDPTLFPGLDYFAFLIRVFVYAKSERTTAIAVRTAYGDTLPTKVNYLGCVASEVAPITPAKAGETSGEEVIKELAKKYVPKAVPGLNIAPWAKTAVDVARAAVKCASGR
jgi:RHS repeat-associated protein